MLRPNHVFLNVSVQSCLLLAFLANLHQYDFNDPEGNGIEVYRDRPSSSWEWQNGKVKMDTLGVNKVWLSTSKVSILTFPFCHSHEDEGLSR
jgi:hypothetical protein